MFLLVCVALLFAGNQLIYGADTCMDTPPCAGCFNCTSATADQCNDTGLGPTLQQLCPLTCGVCVCADNSTACTPEMCTTPGLEQVVKDSCQKTCNFCGPNATASGTTVASTGTTLAGGQTAATTPAGGACVDTNPNCKNWAANGFCTNPFYTGTGDPEKYCKKTCGLCSASAQPADPNCQDSSPDCANWSKNHFCDNATPEQKQQYCAKTCGVC